MSEQYPLLCEEISDEERFSPRFYRRRHLGLRGRAKYHVKGAAAIMSRWPEHWTTLLNFWWIGLGMIALTTFVIYNILFSFSLLQPTDSRYTKYDGFNAITHTSKPVSPPGVFMHVFVNNKEDEHLKRYIPYIELFANKYKDVTYNLIIVANDTNTETTNFTDKTYNEFALNSLWDNDINYGNLVPSNSNINIQYVSLSKYLNNSPIKKHWKNLPHKFILFLVRAVSIWDRGGIAINPIILTPQSPHAAYLEKFITIIKNFKKTKSKIVPEPEKQMPKRKHSKIIPKVNNIRDIINALEREENADNPNQETLTAESIKNIILMDTENKPLIQGIIANKQTNLLDHETKLEKKIVDANIVASLTEASSQVKTASNGEVIKSDNSSNNLPLFFEYLFNNKKTKGNDTTHSMKKRKSPTINEGTEGVDNKDLQIKKNWNDITSSDNYKPMIVSARGIPNNIINETKPIYHDNDKLFELTVDLKGNIIATETPCHAFIGNIFTNASHHNETESLTDFIIKELSIFCKGLLATCMGIDVILV